MRIDAHQHYWELARGDYGWLTPQFGPIYRDFGPADLQPLREAADIAWTIAVQAAPTTAETRHLLRLAESEPSIAGVVGWADFDAHDAPERIADLASDPLLVGLRPMIQDIADPDWMLSDAVARALAATRNAGLVFDALVRPRHLPQLAQLADRNPQLSIVVDHCAKPDIARGGFEPWASNIAALAQRPNVSVKLSGLATEAGAGWTVDDLAPYVDHVIAAFGTDRVIWGSDWPVLNLAGDYACWIEASRRLTAGLPPDALAAVEGGNAQRIYLAGSGRTPC